MDFIPSLAASVVAALVPYLAKAGEEFATVAGKATANKIGELYQTLKKRFKNKTAAKEALADVKETPHDEDAQATLRHQLKKEMTVDQTLRETLQQLLGEIKQDSGSYSFLTQVYGGNVEKIFNIGQVEGGMTFDERDEKR
jgi:hypothetical protein